ncbi:MAG TPA: class I SAM-dependent methyltransferase [Kofleriaceae bacterium]
MTEAIFVDVFGAALEARAFLCDAAIAAGHALGVFEALRRGGSASLERLAAELGVVAGHRLRALLDVLAAIGAIGCERAAGDPPRFVPAATPPGNPVVARAGWGLLADVIRDDRPLPVDTDDDAGGVQRLHHHLASAGAAAARELVASLGNGSLLDLGAGGGAYSHAFLAAHPAARATLVDTREVLDLAAEWLGPLAGRARLLDGDASTTDAGTDHDTALLANLLHLHSPAMCARLCAAAARSVAPGGAVVIKDLRVDDDRAGPIEGLLFALNMAIYTEAGDVYSTSQLRAWLTDAGLVDIIERRLAAAPDAIVVIARRPNDSAESPASRTSSGRAGTVGSTAIGADGGVERDSAESSSRAIGERACAAGSVAGPDGTAERDFAESSAERGGTASTDVAAELDAALARTAEAAWRELAARAAIRDETAASPPVLRFPSALRSFLAAAVAAERREGVDGAERAERLIRHYTDAMPRMQVAQLVGTDEPGATLFHAPLDWHRLPRLSGAIDRLFALLADAGIVPGAGAAGPLGAASAEAFRAGAPTLATLYRRTHYGGFMPLLYGYPADLAYADACGLADGLDVLATIDRYLTAPIVHELCHFAPRRLAISPPHVDECIAGWLGVHVHPELAYPAADHDDALYAAPWLAQVGQAIARAFGIRDLVRAHAGGDPAALPAPFVAAAARLGWDDWCARRTLHFLSDTFDPAPWVALALTIASGRSPANESLASLSSIPLTSLTLPEDPVFDRAIVEDGLRAMCLTSTQAAGSFRTRSQLPDGAIAVDAIACAIIAPGRGALDPTVPRYWLPPAIAAQLHARGLAGYALRLGALTAIPDAAAAICEASPGLERAGYALSPFRAQTLR